MRHRIACRRWQQDQDRPQGNSERECLSREGRWCARFGLEPYLRRYRPSPPPPQSPAPLAAVAFLKFPVQSAISSSLCCFSPVEHFDFPAAHFMPHGLVPLAHPHYRLAENSNASCSPVETSTPVPADCTSPPITCS